MEQQQTQNNEENGKGGYMSRQSSTRWTPTTDQIRILKDLYYNNGIRSPSAEQIQRISARLRQYGKIEGKNVFYWFQNHKARERQKKRFTNDHLLLPPNPTMQQKPNSNNHSNLISSHIHIHTNISSSGLSSASCSSAEMVTLGHGNYGYGSVPMEKSFRECTISAGCSSWIGHNVEPYSSAYANLFEKKLRSNEEMNMIEEEEQENVSPEIETLPLFPMHGEDINHGGYYNIKSNSSNYGSVSGVNWYHQGEDVAFINGNRTTSLELSLNSYTLTSPDYAN